MWLAHMFLKAACLLRSPKTWSATALKRQLPSRLIGSIRYPLRCRRIFSNSSSSGIKYLSRSFSSSTFLFDFFSPSFSFFDFFFLAESFLLESLRFGFCEADFSSDWDFFSSDNFLRLRETFFLTCNFFLFRQPRLERNLALSSPSFYKFLSSMWVIICAYNTLRCVLVKTL